MPADERDRDLEAGALTAPRRYRSLVAHWIGRWPRAPRPVTLEARPAVAPGQLGVTFGGHATTLLRYAGARMVCDPMLGRWVGAVPREVAPGLTVDDLAEVDLVLVTQPGRDHLHLPTLARLPRTATVVVPRGAAARVSPLGFARVVELGAGVDLDVAGVHLEAVAMPRGDGGVAYVVRGDGPSVFVCGDGGYHGGLVEVGRRHAPDVALLPIGGYWPRSFQDRHMSPRDALAAFEDLRARLLVPVRHGAFALSYERLEEPARQLAELVAARGLEAHLCALRPGQSELLVPPSGARGLAAADVDATAALATTGVLARSLCDVAAVLARGGGLLHA
ncbi:MAG: MBL fold metallo-hydrolase [Kofleriaceae bacterium]